MGQCGACMKLHNKAKSKVPAVFCSTVNISAAKHDKGLESRKNQPGPTKMIGKISNVIFLIKHTRTIKLKRVSIKWAQGPWVPNSFNWLHFKDTHCGKASQKPWLKEQLTAS